MNLPICLFRCVFSFTDSSSDSSLGSKNMLNFSSSAVDSSLVCDITSQCDNCSASFISSLGHLLQCSGCSMLLCCTWFLISAAFLNSASTSAWCFKVFSPSFCIMSFLHGSDFTFLGHLSVQRQDTLLDVFCSTLHGPSSFLLVTGFFWKATPSSGIPQSSGRCFVS